MEVKDGPKSFSEFLAQAEEQTFGTDASLGWEALVSYSGVPTEMLRRMLLRMAEQTQREAWLRGYKRTTPVEVIHYAQISPHEGFGVRFRADLMMNFEAYIQWVDFYARRAREEWERTDAESAQLRGRVASLAGENAALRTAADRRLPARLRRGLLTARRALTFALYGWRRR